MQSLRSQDCGVIGGGMKSNPNKELSIERDSLSSAESGAVLIEWAILAAGLFLGFLISFDVGQAINRYMLMTQAAYEGARFASRVPGMEVGAATSLVPDTDQQTACEENTPTSFFCNQYFVQQRIAAAIGDLNEFSNNGIGQNFTVRTEYIPGSAGTGAGDDTVIVELRANLEGYLIPSLPLNVRHQVSYLYETL